jgi:His-Xaa-Ser system protein HxsD
MKTEIKNNEIILIIDKNIYNEDVLHKCFYWYCANYNVEISNHSGESFLVRLIAKHENENLQEALEKVQRDLIDFKLRDIVTKETKTIRELLVAKAFAYYGLDENPTTEISDPVGFNPENALAK